MKIGIGKMVLVLIILSTGLTSLVTSAPAYATVTTSKRNYELGEPVYFTLTNKGTTPIICDWNNPWGIDKLMGGKWTRLFVPDYLAKGWTLNPNQQKTWEWGQNSVTSIPVDAGIYRVVVDISGNQWFAIFTIGDKDSDGLPDTVDGCKYSFGHIYNKGCPFTPYPIVTTSKHNYELGEPVYFTLTNKFNAPISDNTSIVYEIYKLSGGAWTFVYVSGRRTESWILNPNESKTLMWGQWSIMPNLIVDAGIYKVVVRVKGNQWFAIFTIGDKDSDGLPDTVDGCPTTFGRIYKNGCV